MQCSQRLARDHEAIREVANALEPVLAGRTVAPALLAAAVEFFTTLADRCHETMEERVLFPLLVTHDIVDRASIQTLEGEHAEGRRLLAALRGPPLPAEAASLLAAYVALERRHLESEGASIVPCLEQGRLSPAQAADVEAGFDRIEQSVLGADGRTTLLALGGALVHACRAPSSQGPTVLDLLGMPQETLAPDDSLARAAEVMRRLGTRELAVVERGKLVGIVTRTDLGPHRGHLEWTRVRAAMTPDPVTVPPDCSIATAARLLLDCGFNAVAVTVDGHLFGLLRRSDLLRLLRDAEP
jgi:CBS domain-containing protein